MKRRTFLAAAPAALATKIEMGSEALPGPALEVRHHGTTWQATAWHDGMLYESTMPLGERDGTEYGRRLLEEWLLLCHGTMARLAIRDTT